MTEEDWAVVEKRLRNLYSSVTLNCDGYVVYLQLRQISQFKLGILVYVNGISKGSWLFEECEERRRFLPISYLRAYKLKERKMYQRFGKATLKEWNIDLDKKIPLYGFYWTSFQRMKRHFCKNNTTIGLVSDEV